MSTLAKDGNSKAIQVLRPFTTSTVNLSASAASASAIGDARVARIVANNDCFYSVTGTASTTSVYLPANTIEYVHVYKGNVISFITAGNSGIAYVSEMVQAMFGLGVNRLGVTNQATIFTPASLFNNGEAGVWYDPSSINTLYQDYQGVTPVTAVGQPVGLMLDKSEGLAQGAEEITNGDFSNGLTGWVTAGDVSIVSGSAHITNTSTYGAQAFQGVSGLTVGKFYKLTLDTEAISGDSSWYIDDFLGVYVQGVTSGQGRHFYILQATATSFTLQFKKFGAGVVSIDNVSVKEIQGSHATQPTSTKRPIYARHPEGGIRNLLNYTEQLDNGAWSKISTGGAAVSVIPSSYAAPDGTYSATQVLGLDTLNSRLDQTTALPALADKTYTYSVWLRGSGVIGINASSTTGVGGGAEIGVTLTSTWTRHDVTNTFNSSPTGNVRVHGVITRATGTAPEVHMWSPQLEEATEASNYQKVVTDIDVTESGVGEVYYLKFDGVDDGMAINNLTSASTPLTALFGYSATNMNTGTYKFLLDIETGRATYGLADVSNRLGYYDGTWRNFVADTNAIKVLTYDLVEDNAKIRIDGTQEYSDTTYNQQAIGGAIGLFSRFGLATRFVAGNMYQTILRAAESTDEEIAKAETFVANKTGLKAQVDGIATLDLNFGNNTYTAKNSNGGVI